MSARHRIVIRTHDGELLSVLTNIVRWELVRAANEIGWWTMTLDADFSPEFLRIDNIIEFWRQPAGSVETLLGAGFLRYFEWDTNQEDRTMLNIGGPDLVELLNRRTIQNYAETEYSEKTGYADDVMKEIIDEQYLNTTNRYGDIYYSRSSAIPASNFSIAPDTSEGYENASIQAGWRKVLPILQDIAMASWNRDIRLYFDIEYVGPAQLMFQTWADVRGVDRTIGSNIAPVVFSMESGNLSNPILRFDYAEEVNYCTGGGQGQGEAREIDPENDEPRSQLSLWNRRESFKDARECPADEDPTYCIANKAFDEMQNGRPIVKFEGELLDTPTTRFGVDWFYGDKVTIQYRGYEFDGTVDYFTVNFEDDGTETISARVSITEAIQGKGGTSD